MLRRLKAVSMIKSFATGRTAPGLLLCRDDEGTEFEVVVKWRCGPESKDIGGICELLAALLADDLGFKTPVPVLVEIASDFHRALPSAAAAKIAAESVGPNYGSIFMPGMSTWLTARDLPLHLRQTAAEVIAFDVLIENPDRRRDKPNLLSNGDDLLLLDHEQAFSFLRGVIGWRPAWNAGPLNHMSRHVFFTQMKGRQHSFERLNGALEAVSDQRLDEYATLVPVEWKTGNDSTERIVDYVKQARDNRAALFAAITQLLT
jgi:hypothetical protein